MNAQYHIQQLGSFNGIAALVRIPPYSLSKDVEATKCNGFYRDFFFLFFSNYFPTIITVLIYIFF